MLLGFHLSPQAGRGSISCRPQRVASDRRSHCISVTLLSAGNSASGGTFSAWPGQGSGREVFSNGEGKMSLAKIAVAATSVACMTLVSFGWSAQRGVSLSIAGAQAQTQHAQASRHMAASHRHDRRVVRRGYGPNPVAAGAGLAAGAVNTAGAVAAGAIGTAGAIATAPFRGAYAADRAGAATIRRVPGAITIVVPVPPAAAPMPRRTGAIISAPSALADSEHERRPDRPPPFSFGRRTGRPAARSPYCASSMSAV